MTISSTPKAKRICIGKIAGTHGVKGLVKIKPYCDDISLLNSTLFTEEHGDKTLTITLKNNASKYILAQIEGVTTIEQAKNIKSALYIPRDKLPELNDDDEFYIEDLKGLTAVDDKDETIGKVIAVQNFGAGELLEIKPKSGQSYFIPFQDEYVSEINLTKSCVTIQNAEQFIIE